MMNIIEAMTKFNGQYVILISGLSGSGRSKVAKFLADKLKFTTISLATYMYPKTTFDVPENYVSIDTNADNNIRVLPWDDIYKSINWKNFNESVNNSANNFKQKGVIIYGLGFPKTKLEFKCDMHIHLKISTEKLLEKRHSFLKNHPSNLNNIFVDTNIEKQIFNKITIPAYVKARNEGDVTRFINVSDMTYEQTTIAVFKYIIDTTQKWIDNYNKKKSVPITPHNPYDTHYHNKHIKQYDFNNEGIDYPDGPIIDKPTDDDEEKSTSNSDTEFLMTTKNLTS